MKVSEAELRRLVLNVNASCLLGGQIARGEVVEERDVNRAVQQAQAIDCAVRSRLRWEKRREEGRRS